MANNPSKMFDIVPAYHSRSSKRSPEGSDEAFSTDRSATQSISKTSSKRQRLERDTYERVGCFLDQVDEDIHARHESTARNKFGASENENYLSKNYDTTLKYMSRPSSSHSATAARRSHLVDDHHLTFSLNSRHTSMTPITDDSAPRNQHVVRKYLDVALKSPILPFVAPAAPKNKKMVPVYDTYGNANEAFRQRPYANQAYQLTGPSPFSNISIPAYSLVIQDDHIYPQVWSGVNGDTDEINWFSTTFQHAFQGVYVRLERIYTDDDLATVKNNRGTKICGIHPLAILVTIEPRAVLDRRNERGAQKYLDSGKWHTPAFVFSANAILQGIRQWWTRFGRMDPNNKLKFYYDSHSNEFHPGDLTSQQFDEIPQLPLFKPFDYVGHTRYDGPKSQLTKTELLATLGNHTYSVPPEVIHCGLEGQPRHYGGYRYHIKQ